ncbi:MAG: cyclase family protein [Rhodothermales bacterium]
MAALLIACQSSPPEPAATAAFPAGRLIDLSHAYDSETIYWPTEDGFQLEVGAQGMTEGGWYYEAFSFTSAEHGGTHLDAPIHFAEGRRTVDAIPLEDLIGKGIVVDVSEAALTDPDYQVSVADFEVWEAEHGPLPDGSIVLLRTGYAQFWPDRVRYMGTDERGADAVALLHFPGLHPDAAQWLVDNRRIAAIGLDTPSVDYGQSGDFMAHRILFEANIPAFENVADMRELPPKDFTILALPMKIGEGSGAPLRIVAMVPE